MSKSNGMAGAQAPAARVNTRAVRARRGARASSPVVAGAGALAFRCARDAGPRWLGSDFVPTGIEWDRTAQSILRTKIPTTTHTQITTTTGTHTP
jgi:hypothetical protein